ncbi:hypothetical protein FQN50_002895 [Emmonsiellopsis sp. PD_5]|nr:hypothetical protein FQN50_002895 [Emmonsiellopsis sp. PD_5]
MYLDRFSVLATCLASALPAFGKPLLEKRATWGPVSDSTIWSPADGFSAPGVLYARSEIIGDTLFATAENYSPEPPVFPIYTSVDQGLTWTHLSDVADTVNGWGMRYQPHLYVLKNALGTFPAGTLLVAGNSIPQDLSLTSIDLYASTDQGVTWSFVSNIAKGGRAVGVNGETPIWEPFLMEYQGQLIIYYSDQRDPAHGQKLVHTTSTDLLSWTPVVNDVAEVYEQRPGMATIALMPNGEYIYFYEWGNGPSQGVPNAGYPIYYRISADPLNFLNAPAQQLIGTDGSAPINGSPYVVWTPSGGENGMLIVNTAADGDLYMNTNLGDPASWNRLSAGGAPSAYTRSLRVLPDPNYVLIVGAGNIGSTWNGAVRADVVQVA